MQLPLVIFQALALLVVSYLSFKLFKACASPGYALDLSLIASSRCMHIKHSSALVHHQRSTEFTRWAIQYHLRTNFFTLINLARLQLVLIFSVCLQLSAFISIASAGMWINKVSHGALAGLARHAKIYLAAFILTLVVRYDLYLKSWYLWFNFLAPPTSFKSLGLSSWVPSFWKMLRDT